MNKTFALSAVTQMLKRTVITKAVRRINARAAVNHFRDESLAFSSLPIPKITFSGTNVAGRPLSPHPLIPNTNTLVIRKRFATSSKCKKALLPLCHSAHLH